LKQNTVIFDLDGTLALIDHRMHFIDCPSHRQDWASFFQACIFDAPNEPLIRLFQMIKKEYEVFIYTGRSDEVRSQTIEWLQRHGVEIDEAHLLMRKQGDYTADEALKKLWAVKHGLESIAMIFDDRAKVVKMWRELGLTCMQVAPGDF